MGKPVNMLVPQDRPLEMANILSRVARGNFVEHFQTVRRRKDQTTVAVSLTVVPVRDRHGKVIGGSATARRTTKRGRPIRHNSEPSPDPARVVKGLRDL